MMKPRATRPVTILSSLFIATLAHAERYVCTVDDVAVEMDIPCAESPLTDTYKINREFRAEVATQEKISERKKAEEAKARIDALTTSLKIDPDAGAAGWKPVDDKESAEALKAAERALVGELKDPGSYERISHSPVWEKQAWRFVGIEYRARNSFGACSIGRHAFAVDWRGGIYLERPWNGFHITTAFSDHFSPPKDLRLALTQQSELEPAGDTALEYARNSVGFTHINATKAVSANGSPRVFVKLFYQTIGAKPLTDLKATLYFVNALGTEILDKREVTLVSSSDTPLELDGLNLGNKDFVFSDISGRWRNDDQIRATITGARFVGD